MDTAFGVKVAKSLNAIHQNMPKFEQKTESDN